MKKYVTVLSLVVFTTQLTMQVTFAQAVTPAPGSTSVLAQVTNPTPTAKVTQPPSTPAPTTAPTATQVTSTPTPAKENSTPTSQPSQTTNPTPTPTPLPPTPTTKPKPVLLANRTKPPLDPISQIIAAPFDLVMNSLPQSYYNDAGLAPTTTRILIAAGMLGILSGILLLKWPALVRAKNRMFAPTLKERSYPYVAGRL